MHIAQGDAEVARSHIFELMGLVEDHGRAFRQHSRVRRRLGHQLDRHIGEEEMMIHDDHVALERAAAHLGDEAPLVVGAALSETSLASRVELGPYRTVFRQLADLGAISGRGRLLPGGNLLKVIDLLQAVQDRLIAQRIQFVAAQIVRPALHVADAQRSQERFEKGQIAEEELLLQILCAGRDDDPLPHPKSRQQVGERLAGTGTGLDDEVSVLRERAFDRSRHLELAAAKLVGQARAREHSSGGEELIERRQRRSGAGDSGQGRDPVEP